MTQLSAEDVDAALKAFTVHGEPMYLRVTDLIVDSRYQRPLNQRRVRAIAAEFDPDAIGMLYVSIRSDNTKVVLDGQHRKASLIAMGWGDQMVPCFAYRNLTLEDEARIFRIMNENRARPTSIDLFRTKIAEKDPQALDLQAILGANGLRIGYASDAGWFRAISAAQKVYSTSGRDSFRKVIEVIHGSWPSYADPWACSSDMVLGLGLLLAEYESSVDLARLVSKLSSETPSNLIGKAKSLRANLGGSVPTNVAITLIVVYNKGVRTRRLQDLQSRSWRRNPLVLRSQDNSASDA